jgi:UDP-2,3-diacylglucosamine pyrophosphatase LpxH
MAAFHQSGGAGKMEWRTIFVSDVHLGSNAAKAESLLRFLQEVDCGHLVLLGDIIDAWALKRRWYWPSAHQQVVEQILSMARRGVQVTYIIGNHDGFLMPLSAVFQSDIISLKREMVYRDVKGNDLLVTHGDVFDQWIKLSWFSKFFGDASYMMLLKANRLLDRCNRFIGRRRPWSLSLGIKEKLPGSRRYIALFEKWMAHYAQKRGMDGVICGHIHRRCERRIKDVQYRNTGDWVESCSFWGETPAGDWRLMTFAEWQNEVPHRIRVHALAPSA